jgi:hypothetical protein
MLAATPVDRTFIEAEIEKRGLSGPWRECA